MEIQTEIQQKECPEQKGQVWSWKVCEPGQGRWRQASRAGKLKWDLES